ncbi:MAG: hypothetical protein GXY44_00460 [Phycisphaerales bacterium]|nr:hypothetical protein [Phycisphaerales bacterium]
MAFIKEVRPEEWHYIENLQKDKAAETSLDDLCLALDSEHEGCFSVLWHVFQSFDKLLHVACFASASGMNQKTKKWYEAKDLYPYIRSAEAAPS